MTDIFGCIFLLLTCVCHIQLHVDIPLVVVFGVVERWDVKKEFPGSFSALPLEENCDKCKISDLVLRNGGVQLAPLFRKFTSSS